MPDAKQPLWAADECGLRFHVRGATEPEAKDAASLLLQLEDDGFAEAIATGWLLPWQSLYALRRSPEYAAAPALLKLPPERPVVPVLASTGTLTDRTFTIGIEGWLTADGTRADITAIVGGLAHDASGDGLLPESVWHLRRSVIAFLNRPDDARDELSQRQAWGTIRQLALAADARMSTFLVRTVVLTPERLRIDLRRGEGAGSTVVEVMPSFEGAPAEWLDTFDRFPAVQGRYDIPTRGGLVQVIITQDVRTVLREVKRMKGRRVTGPRAEAFVTNPFSALGDAASRVIDPDQFEAARAAANLLFERFTGHIKHDALGYPEEVGLLIERAAPAGGGARSELHLFKDDDELDGFVAKVRRQIQAGHQLCVWEGCEFELTGDTEGELDLLTSALLKRRKPRILVSYADIYDLSNYAARVEDIGQERPYYSPFVAKPASDPWAPETIQYGVTFKPKGQEAIAVPFTAETLQQLQGKVRDAQEANASHVQYEALTHEPIPRAEAEYIVQVLTEVLGEVKAGTFTDPRQSIARDSHPPRRPALLIKANIQSIDYEEARREALLEYNPIPKLPRALKPGVELKQHQSEGVAWLQHLLTKCPAHCRGAVLADDMGLGKTLQILTALAAAFEHDPDLPPALVVAPVSLLENWKEEVDKFFRSEALPLLTAYGDDLAPLRLPREAVDSQLQQEGLVCFLRPGWRGKARVVLTTYETLRDLEFSFAREKWSVMVCDEAQKIKNPNALVTRAAKKQKVQFKIACTGTPVENTLADLWCLFDFVQPGLLGALADFGHRYRRPIEAKTEQEKALVEELRAKIEPQVLRRLKKDVAKDLPRKIVVDSCSRLPLSPAQRALYARAIEMFHRRGQGGTPFKNVLGLLHHLRLLCTDPHPHGRTVFVPEPIRDYRARSPKLDWLLSTLDDIRSKGEKAIVFCEFREVQRMLRHYIEDAFGLAPDVINGDTPAAGKHIASRQKRIKAFQARAGFGVIILSPVAVGFGVNIQAANHVIHFSRTWNPAKEDQATDRAYRIGQTRDVYVYYPVVAAPDFTTFDVKLDELLNQKRALADDMLNGNVDINPRELDLRGLAPAEAGEFIDPPVSLDDMLRMPARHFEALIAALWHKRGYRTVYRTPDAGDHGVDVVAFTEPNGDLVQCKSSSVDQCELSWEAVKDVVTGHAAYSARHTGITFAKSCATNQYFNANAAWHAELNKVELYDQSRLVQLLQATPVTTLDVEYFVTSSWTEPEADLAA